MPRLFEALRQSSKGGPEGILVLVRPEDPYPHHVRARGQPMTLKEWQSLLAHPASPLIPERLPISPAALKIRAAQDK